jgi:hypothetical protein
MSKEVAAEIEIVTLARHIFLADVSTFFHLSQLSPCTVRKRQKMRKDLLTRFNENADRKWPDGHERFYRIGCVTIR